MSAIIHVMGRLTKDPVMQQGKNNGTEYISLDIASSQRSQNPQNQKEPFFYQCFFNKFLAERLLKANLKSGSCIYVYGDLEVHPFLYQQGPKAGQPGISAKITVKDWQFCLANKPEQESQGAPVQYPNNGMTQPASGNAYQASGLPNGYGNAQTAVTPVQRSSARQNNVHPSSTVPATGAPAYSPNYQPHSNMAYGQQSNFIGDGFQAIPEGMADQLPYSG